MAKVFVKEVWDNRKATRDDKFKRTYTRTFLAKSDTNLDGPQVVREYVGVPRIGDPYFSGNDFDTGSWCRDVEVTVNKSAPRLWDVTATYSSELEDPSRQNENPTLRKVDIRWGGQKYQRVAEFDRYGRAITNSAGVPYDPPIERDDTRPMLTITRNEAFYSPVIGFTYTDAVNSDPFMGAGALAWKCAGIVAESAFENGQYYWKVTYSFEHRAEGWIRRIMDRGKSCLKNGKLTAITDSYGTPVSEPQPLDGKGAGLPKAFPTLVDAIDKEETVFEITSNPFTSNVPFWVFVENEIMLVKFITPPSEAPPTFVEVQRDYPPHNVAHAAGTAMRQQPVYIGWELYNPLPFGLLNLP